MSARIVIVAYKPKPGQSKKLEQLMREHLAVLKKEDLVSNRDSIIMEAADGTIVEVFEWKSKAAIEKAHTHPAVLKMWGEYAEVCDYIPIGELPESKSLFSEFTPFE